MSWPAAPEPGDGRQDAVRAYTVVVHEPQNQGPPAWHPPHLERPQVLTYSAPRRRLSPAVIALGGVLLVLGVSVWVSAGVALRSRMFGSEGLVWPIMLCIYVFGPALSVTGTVLLALGRSKRAWIVAAASSLVLGFIAVAATAHATRRNVANECYSGTQSACMELGEKARTDADRAEWYARACKLGDVRGCVRWGRAAPDMPEAPTEGYRMFCDEHPEDYRCGHGTVDLHTMCTNDPGRYECMETRPSSK